ncbi:MAG: hypothetical protein ACM35G_06930 [Planctomycetaceae bacterium]
MKAADAGMKVSEAPLGLQRMHRSMQLTALACELRRTGVEEGIEVGDLETAIVEVGRSFGLPRDLIDKEIAHNRARYTEEVAISCAQVEARARGAASAARERIDAEGRQADWGGPADPHRPMGMRIGGPMDGVLAELISHVKEWCDESMARLTPYLLDQHRAWIDARLWRSRTTHATPGSGPRVTMPPCGPRRRCTRCPDT